MIGAAPKSDLTTVGASLDGSIRTLTGAGVDSPRLDAELLLAQVLGLARSDLVAHPDRALSPVEREEFGALVERRSAREPVAYILGSQGFRHITLLCDRRALIPRPETELLVEIAAELAPSSVLDVGTGTGAVALAVADESPGCRVVATDTSPRALDLARLNLQSLGLEDRVILKEESVPGGGRFDLLVTNLPYVSESDWEGLQPEVRDWEPRSALVPGRTGLEAFRQLLGSGGTLSRLAGNPDAIALEVGIGQAPEVGALVSEAGYDSVEVRKDLAGVDRVVLGRRSA